MQYRRFGKLDWQASVLGFGAMRLPVLGDKSVDEERAIRLIRHAIDGGINYIDTAYIYHRGASESVVGKALGDGYRAKVKIATKSPIWQIRSAADFDRILAEQMQRLAVERIDFYMFHGIGKQGWRSVLDLGLLERAEAARTSGRIGHIGFSFHDKHEVFKEIVDGYDGWEFCQIQYNYMDVENQAGTRGLAYAAAKGLPVVVMEPLLGGRLATPPASVQEVFARNDSAAPPQRRTPAAWALRWLWHQPEVTTVLSGMSTMDQLEENLEIAATATAGRMTADELSTIEEVRALLEARAVVPCTRCDYCLPCPQGVEISRVFDLYNSGVMYDDPSGSRFDYRTFVPERAWADKCAACGDCEARCPQGIEIATWMPKVHAVLGEDAPY